MTYYKKITLLIILLALIGVGAKGSATASPDSEERESSLFTTSSSELSPRAVRQLNSLVDKIRSKGDSVQNITVAGSSSPDGNFDYNRRLSGNRAKSIADYLDHNLPGLGFAKNIENLDENWPYFKQLVTEDLNLPRRDKVLEICASAESPDAKERRLRALPAAWSYLKQHILPKMRMAVVSVRLVNKVVMTDTIVESLPEPVVEEIPVVEGIPVETTEVVEEQIVEEPVEIPLPVEKEEWQRHAYAKTNLPAWFMLWINAAGEIDIAPHWSANLSLYYSGFNYFKETVKFRTFTIMPEVRYWFRADNQGFFVAPHFGLGWYNAAFDGDYRYQDHNGDTPAIGGGVNVGFRFNLSSNRRWKMEFSAGFGIYRLDYDLFQNRHNGLLVDRHKRTFYGLDNAAISLCYMFDVKKKGGAK